MKNIKKLCGALMRRMKKIPLFRVRKSDNPLRWGIIGLGNMAEVFAEAIDGHKDAVVYAVASREQTKAERFAARHACHHAYGSYADMLADDSIRLDVVYVATPARCHYDNIKQCLQAGKNVVCEKPICSNASELKDLMELAREKGLFLMEGMWSKCLPTFQKAKEWESRIGNKQLVRIDFYKRELIRPELTIFNPEAGGGVLHDYGVYAIAFAESFLGRTPDINSAHKRISIYGIDSDWQIYGEADGVEAYISLSSDFGSISKAAIIGTEGTIEFESQFNRTDTLTLYDKQGRRLERFCSHYRMGGLEYEIDEVNRCLRTNLKESTLVSLNESLETLKWIDLL